MGVVVRRYIEILINNYNFSLLHLHYIALCSNIPTSSFIFKMFFCSCLCYFVAQRTHEIVHKMEFMRI